MDNRVYYGEYSLKHWIDLILKQNIILPDYQRYFVWSEKKVNTLIETLKNKQFVPPITVGAFKIGDTNLNLILDGQQRLTSILLAYLGLYPDAQIYKSAIEQFASENDEEQEEEDTVQLDNILEWNFSKLTEKGKNKSIILSEVVEGNYKSIDLQIDDEFLKSTFLGFSYLVPSASDESEQQKYYSSVFRNINIQGEPLLPQESRASLYFLDHNLVNFFSPEFFKRLTVKTISSEAKADFVRYLSLLSQYHKDGNANRVARGFKPKMEKFYEEYIFNSINNIDSETYGKLTDIIENKNYDSELSTLRESIEQLNIPKEYPSIIDSDTFLFGLIYNVIFNKRKIDMNRKDELQQKLSDKVSQYKEVYSHKRSPNNLGHLRTRITDSISIYNQYLSDES